MSGSKIPRNKTTFGPLSFGIIYVQHQKIENLIIIFGDLARLNTDKKWYPAAFLRQKGATHPATQYTASLGNSLNNIDHRRLIHGSGVHQTCREQTAGFVNVLMPNSKQHIPLHLSGGRIHSIWLHQTCKEQTAGFVSVFMPNREQHIPLHGIWLTCKHQVQTFRSWRFIRHYPSLGFRIDTFFSYRSDVIKYLVNFFQFKNMHVPVGTFMTGSGLSIVYSLLGHTVFLLRTTAVLWRADRVYIVESCSRLALTSDIRHSVVTIRHSSCWFSAGSIFKCLIPTVVYSLCGLLMYTGSVPFWQSGRLMSWWKS